MTLKELQYLVALADQRRFVRAAEACHVGQPTLSTQLKKLEDYLGVTLFERNKHYLIPTPVGEQIIERARIALDVVDQIRQLARQGDDPMGGSLRLGVIPTLGPYLVPHLLPRCGTPFPAASVPARGPDGESAGAAQAGTARCAAAGAAAARRRCRRSWRCFTSPSRWPARRPRPVAQGPDQRGGAGRSERAAARGRALHARSGARHLRVDRLGRARGAESHQPGDAAPDGGRGGGLYLAAGAAPRCRGWGRSAMGWSASVPSHLLRPPA